MSFKEFGVFLLVVAILCGLFLLAFLNGVFG
jgi:hypothetical protein